MNYNQTLVFKSNKKTLEMNQTSDYNVLDIQGIEASSYSINTANSEQDGATITSIKVQPREITITGTVNKNDNELVNRDYLIRFFNPKQVGTMFITRNNVARKIEYSVSSLDFTTNKMYDYIEFTLTIESTEDPYFSDAKNSGNFLTLITPQFAFPLGIISNKGKAMGYKTFKPVMPLVNDGDKETGVEIIITAKRGAMQNITLTLNNNTEMKVNCNLEQWDVLRINTNPRHKQVTLNGQNIISQIDRTSNFFKLKIGKNILGYTCDNGGTNIDIDVQFYRKYLGV